MRKIALLMAALLGAAGGAVAEESVPEEGAGAPRQLDQGAGMVLQDGCTYEVRAKKDLTATMPGQSALKLLPGTSATLVISNGATLTVRGGDAIGRVPAGAGIEVPRGAKLLICGEGTVEAYGGNPAAGGMGYGGFGGLTMAVRAPTYVEYTNGVTAAGTEEEFYRSLESNGVSLTNFCAKESIIFDRVGGGGNGGDGGGGGGAAIGGRGGFGGVGGAGGGGRLVVGESGFAKREEDYWLCAQYFGLGQPFVYNGNSIPQKYVFDGANGASGFSGLSGVNVGEVVVAGSVTVNCHVGGAGDGGVCGSYGPTVRKVDGTYLGDGQYNGTAFGHFNTWGGITCTFVSIGIQFGNSVLGWGLKGGWSIAFGTAGPAVLAVTSLIQWILDLVGVSEWKALRKVVWYIGGGAGGGGGGGAAPLKGIGGGGPGGGGGSGGGGGFFVYGPGNVYSVDSHGKPDLTVPPLELSGSGGVGGESVGHLHDGMDASFDHGGEASRSDKTTYEKRKKKPKYSNFRNGRYGGWSLIARDDTVWAYGGLGGKSGGSAGDFGSVSNKLFKTKQAVIMDYVDGQPRPYAKNEYVEVPSDVSPKLHVSFYTWDGALAFDKDFIIGTLSESVPQPVTGPAGQFFTGYYTAKQGGEQYFDEFGYPVIGTVLTNGLSLYQQWTSSPPPSGIRNVVTVSDSLPADGLKANTIYDFTVSHDFGAVSLPDTGTTVFNIRKNVNVSFKGPDTQPCMPAAPGIRVPQGAELVITGSGNLSATGGKAYPAQSGEKGVTANYKGQVSGTLTLADASYQNWSNFTYYVMSAGVGGRGGAGGSGGAPGIGGAGGAGGAGGGYLTTKNSLPGYPAGVVCTNLNVQYDAWYTSDDYNPDWKDGKKLSYSWNSTRSGVNGTNGGSGSNGETCGKVYVIGDVNLNVQRSKDFNTGSGQGGYFGDWAWVKYNSYYWAAFGSGGGGGGGGGTAAEYAIGGGGGGGGGGGQGGGGGATYAFYAKTIHTYKLNGEGGSGGFGAKRVAGKTLDGDGASGGAGTKRDGKTCPEVDIGGTKYTYVDTAALSSVLAGHGGTSSTTVAVNGGPGAVFCTANRAAMVSGMCGNNQRIVNGHPALGRTITFYRQSAANGWDKIGSLRAKIGMPLPTLPTNFVSGVRGYVFSGAYQVDGSVTNQWYGLFGEPEKDGFDGLQDVDLYVEYMPDYWSMAEVPNVLRAIYHNTNYVAYAPCAGCHYVPDAPQDPTCATNAMNAGKYHFSVELDTGYTIWSDLSTDPRRRVDWVIEKSMITNEWTSPRMTYDWSISRDENLKIFNPDFSTALAPGVLGFPLPYGVTADFLPGRRISENEVDLVVKLTGGMNYMDRTLHGFYTVPQVLKLDVVSHYPWAEKVDIVCQPNDPYIGGTNQDWIVGFEKNYMNKDVDVSVLVKQGGGTAPDEYWTQRLCTVRDLVYSDGSMVCKTLDLSKLHAKLGDVRTNAIPLFVSIDGIMCAGQNFQLDFTGRMSDGALEYSIHDTADLLPFQLSPRFVDDPAAFELSERVKTYLCVTRLGPYATHSSGYFRPSTPLTRVSDTMLEWYPETTGRYLLEHVVSNGVKVTGYRMAYFSICDAPDGTPAVIRSRPYAAAVIEGQGARPATPCSSLSEAAELLWPGDILRILTDVQMDLAVLPLGTTVVVERDGVFREPTEEDVPPYAEMQVKTNGVGKVVEVIYSLSEEKTKPRILGAGLCDGGSNFTFRVRPVIPGFDYGFAFSENLRDWAEVRDAEVRDIPPDEVEAKTPVRSGATNGFYRISMSDDAPLFETQPYLAADGRRGLSIVGSGRSTERFFDGRLTIPAELDGKKVLKIADGAFSNCTTLAEVNVMPGVEIIGDRAFANCANLVHAYLPESLVAMGDGVFANDGALRRLTIPASVVSIGSLVLQNLRELRFLGERPTVFGDVSLPDGCLVYVPFGKNWFDVPGAWKGCRLAYWTDFTTRLDADGSLTVTGCAPSPVNAIEIPGAIDGVRVARIAAYALANHEELKSVKVCDGIGEIGEGAFAGCSNLEALDIAASVANLGAAVFGSFESGLYPGIQEVRFRGNAPLCDGDQFLNPSRCTIVVPSGGIGWGEKWYDCVVVRGSDEKGPEMPAADPMEGYRPVSGIESTGLEYINTEYLRPERAVVECSVSVDANQPSGSEFAVFGASENSSNGSLYLLAGGSENQNRAVYGYGNKTGLSEPGAFPLGKRLDVRCDSISAVWGMAGSLTGATKRISGAIATKGRIPMTLFARNREISSGGAAPGGESWTKMTLHSFKVSEYENDTDIVLRRDFVPCVRNADGCPGLYEKTDGKFFANASGKGGFKVPVPSAEPRIMDPAYESLAAITSTGFQYIDTGHVPTSDTRVECVVMLTSDQGNPDPAVFGSVGDGGGDRDMAFFVRRDGKETPAYFRNGRAVLAEQGLPYTLLRLVCEGSNAVWHARGDMKDRRGIVNATESSGKGSGLSMLLFAAREADGTVSKRTTMCAMSLYLCRIWEGDVLKHDFVPCLEVSSQAVGLYDLVERRFFENKGTQPFIIDDRITIINANFEQNRILSDGKAYAFGESIAYQAEDGQSAMSLPRGRAMLIIPEEVTITLTGGAAQGVEGAGAGIEVGDAAELIICGKGRLIATGGNAARGFDAPEQTDKAGYLDGGNNLMYSAPGGDGGAGGGGAGAGIGGRGGRGGGGGRGAPAKRACYDYSDGGNACAIGGNGGNGNPGGFGGTGGTVVLAPTLKYMAQRGTQAHNSGGRGGGIFALLP